MDTITPTCEPIHACVRRKSNDFRPISVGSFRAFSHGVKPILAFAAFALLGCSGASFESIYDIPTGPYEGGGGSSSPGSSSANGADADTCNVQGTAAVSGAVGGAAFTAMDAVELFDVTKAKYTFQLTDYASACSLGLDVHAGSSVVSISYESTELVAGTYDLAKTPGLAVSYVRYDANCKATQTLVAASGSVTFGKLDICGNEGSIDIVIGGVPITATFKASVCTVTPKPATCR